MKNLLKISITTLGTLAILGTSAFAVTGIVNAPNGLVLREEASKTAKPITTLSDKTEVEVIEKDGDWYKVTYNSQEGYLFSEYVETTEDVTTPETPVEPENPNSVQEVSKLKVYNIPLITSTVINEIEPSAEITVIKQITNWSYVSAGNIQGWVRTYGLEGGTEVPVPEVPSEEPNNKPEEPEEPSTPTVSQPEESETPDEETTYDDPSNTTQTETSSTATKGFVAVDSATVREEPTTNSSIVTFLTKDTSFTIKAETEEWYKIEYTGIDGTVYKGYIYKPLVTT